MTRAFFGVLKLLKIILYSKYESRHMRRHEGCTVAVFRRLVFRHRDEYRSACQRSRLRTYTWVIGR